MHHKPIETTELGKNPVRTREHNRRVVLDLLRHHGCLERKTLASLTQLSTPAIANILESLLEDNLILDMGRKKKGRGQPPLQFTLNPDGAYTIGFEISLNGVVTAALDLSGNPIIKRRQALSDLSIENCIKFLSTEKETIAQSAQGMLLGIGVVMPGPFAIEGFSGTDPTTLPHWNPQFHQQLCSALEAPVWIENDANAAILAESLFGKGAQLNNFAMLYFGVGIGLGIISDGRLYRGSRGNAGEIGHTLLNIPLLHHPNEMPYLEHHVSRYALAEKLNTPLSPGSVLQLWQNKNPILLQWIEDSAPILGAVISMLENILDPETIILGGQLPAPVIDAMIAAIPLYPTVAQYPRELPRLIRGDTGAYTAALGAATLPFYDTLSSNK